jgi:hypothetical protein
MQIAVTLSAIRATTTVAVVLLALGAVALLVRTLEPVPRPARRRNSSGSQAGRRRPDGPVDDASSGGDSAQGVPGARTLAEGAFSGLEHGTTGQAVIVELQDGSRFLRLEDLETSNGPDLRVILTDQPLSQDWGVWDDGGYVDLGGLKGNLGSSNYEIPADVDLGDFETAVIWCRRFSVGFGVAPLEPAA